MPISITYRICFWVTLLDITGGTLCQKSTIFRIVLATWLLALIVLTYAYTGTLISKLTAPEHRFVINSLEDAVANENIMPFVVKESSVQEEFIVKIKIGLTLDRLLKGHFFFSCHLPLLSKT